MDSQKVGRLWNENADAWTHLARAGYDIYRDYLNTPAFMEMLPDVEGLFGLDIACGEGHQYPADCQAWSANRRNRHRGSVYPSRR